MTVYITEDGKVAFSKNWPEPPAIMASANADAIAHSNYRRRIKELMKTPVWVRRPEELIVRILKTEGLITIDVLVEVDVRYTIHQDNGQYFVEWYDKDEGN